MGWVRLTHVLLREAAGQEGDAGHGHGHGVLQHAHGGQADLGRASLWSRFGPHTTQFVSGLHSLAYNTRL